MIFILDTNIFLRVLIKEDKQTFTDCVNFLELVKNKKIEAVVPGVVLSEIAWVLKSFYSFSKSKIVKALKSIIKLNGLEIVDDYDYDQALDFYSKKNVKYIDCLIASLAKGKNYTVISYDQDFDKLKVKRREPSSF